MEAPRDTLPTKLFGIQPSDHAKLLKGHPEVPVKKQKFEKRPARSNSLVGKDLGSPATARRNVLSRGIQVLTGTLATAGALAAIAGAPNMALAEPLPPVARIDAPKPAAAPPAAAPPAAAKPAAAAPPAAKPAAKAGSAGNTARKIGDDFYKAAALEDKAQPMQLAALEAKAKALQVEAGALQAKSEALEVKSAAIDEVVAEAQKVARENTAAKAAAKQAKADADAAQAAYKEAASSG
jgi:hypothetical protein